jgi:hypothetical protein
MSRRSWTIGALVAFSIVPPSDAAAQTPIPVLATRAVEAQPAAGGLYLAWIEAPGVRSTRFNAYARLEGQPRFRLNAPGTQGFTTGGAIDGARLVYGQVKGRRPGDLMLFDLVTRTRSSPPTGVNTRRSHESGGSLSGDWLLFTRGTRATLTARIVLFNLATGEARQLDIARGKTIVGAGAVRGGYATWVKCRRPTRCDTYVYDIAAGVVYFVESRRADCRPGVAAIWRYPLGGTQTRLLSLPRGRDPSDLSPLVNADGSTTLFYDSIRCRTGASDILKLVLPG